MSDAYVELHAKSYCSFGMGASHVHELLAQVVEYGYGALALTDANLCGALEFARLAGSLGIRPLTGGELTLADGSRVALLAKTREGYANISHMFTLANAHDRRQPRLNPAYLAEHAGGVALLTGALPDRLTHYVHILKMNGDISRLRHSRENAISSASEEPDDAWLLP